MQAACVASQLSKRDRSWTKWHDVVVVLAILLAVVEGVSAYEVETHRPISQRAVDLSAMGPYLRTHLAMGAGVKEEIRGIEVRNWIAEGSVREDDTLRFLNHFHNPLTHWGVAGLLQLGQSSVLWGQNPGQKWSWFRTRDHYREALTHPEPSTREGALSRTFRGLGQLIHLIQDASVPAHTRNDPHYGWSYEKLVRAVEFNAADKNEVRFIEDLLNSPRGPDPAWRSRASNPLAPVPVAGLIDSNQYVSTDDFTGTNPGITTRSDIGIAEYTNANFLSEDSVWGSRLRPFRYPAKSSVTEIEAQLEVRPGEFVPRWYYWKQADGETGYRLATVGFLRDYFFAYSLDASRADQRPGLDEVVYKDYATYLLPRAVGYSVALLDYFFRGEIETRVMDARLDSTGLSATLRLTNRTPGEAMAGNLALYYDTAGGERVPLVSWPLSLGAGGEVDLPPIPAPRQDKPPVEPGRYLAVFEGTLGDEAGAIAATWFTVSAGYVRVLGLSQSCTRQPSNQMLCQDTLGESGRVVMPQPDGTVEFAGEDTLVYHFMSRTLGGALYPNDGPYLYLNHEDNVMQALYLYREGGGPFLRLTVQASGASYTPCYVDWGTLSGSPQALGTSTYYDPPKLSAPGGGGYLPGNGTYDLEVGSEPLLFRFFSGAALLPPLTGAGTVSGSARCDFASIRFSPR